MKTVGLIGVGRMGKVLTGKLASHVNLKIFDRDENRLLTVSRQLGVTAAANLGELVELGTIILVVPDREVISLIKEFNQLGQPVNIINVATNVTKDVMAETASAHLRCIGTKFVAQAKEMAQGAEPIIIVDEEPAELAALVQAIFAPVGKIIFGQADCVAYINTQAAEQALTAAVLIEETLCRQAYASPDVIKSAIRQVAAGIMKAYADDDLGPFAREVVSAVRSKLSKQ